MPEASFRCWKCHEFVRANFHHDPGTHPYEWFAACPHCHSINYLDKPGWTRKYAFLEIILGGDKHAVG